MGDPPAWAVNVASVAANIGLIVGLLVGAWLGPTWWLVPILGALIAYCVKDMRSAVRNYRATLR